MKRSRWVVLAVVAAAGWAGGAFAQAPAGGAAGTAAAGAGAAGSAKVGFFEKACIKLGKCRRTLCTMPAGQMLGAMIRPVSQLSGGIIPPFCPAMPTVAEQQEAGSKGAAAQGKADAADAKARVGAVYFLGTQDCHWHPEAEAGLVKALRTDRNECVRLAAAVALNRGCCCTKAILDALTDCVNGTEVFGPYENSPRVQNVALMALEHCLSCYQEPAVVIDSGTDGSKKEKDKKEGGIVIPPPTPGLPAEAKPMNSPAPPPPAGETTVRYSGRPTPEQYEKAKIAVARARARGLGDTVENTNAFVSGQRDLYHLWRYVVDGGKTVNTSVATPTPMVAQVTPKTQPMPLAAGKAVPLSPALGQPMPVTPYSPTTSATPNATAKPAPAATGAPAAARPMNQTPAPIATGTSAPTVTGTPTAARPMNPTPTTPPAELRLMNPVATPAPAELRPLRPAPAAVPVPVTTPAPAATLGAAPAARLAAPRTIDAKVLKCLETLRDAPDPEVRHTAVKMLASVNWQENPEAVLALVHTARTDKHPGMRVASVRTLASMKACTPEVMTGLKPMTADKDEWIRSETTQALTYLQTVMAISADAPRK